MSEELRARLAARLTGLCGGPVEVSAPERLTGGASRETWTFRATTATDARQLILRRDPPGYDRPESMGVEAAVIAAAARSGVPVPALLDHDADPAVLGAPYLISEHVEGETIPRRLLREPEFAGVRPTLAAELGRVLARIHRIPVERVPGLAHPDPLAALEADHARHDEPLPALELGLRWLREHRPPPAGDVVVHGDFRNGNLIVDPRGLRAVLDWELVHRGDPLEDLGWLCVKAWRFAAAPPVGGFGERADLFAGYAEVAGWAPDPAAVHWWEVYGTVKWAVGCRDMARRHLTGADRSVELVAIGRRVCEQEHDLLLALGIRPSPEDAPEPAAPEPDLHGRPTAVELVEAVAEFLRTDARPALEGRSRFHALVAENALGAVERELRLGPRQRRRRADRLTALGYRDEAELAAAVRAGADGDDVLAAVREGVTDRLLVANPRYLGNP
ncbi:phosphotransferase [Saccharopolyspora sp. NFXS83]|uniref:phosphotransferase family protein n=1 Tax=Saccharopolyspora sp. NFXS83 TaxID=2993560 RepID=UPI00224AABB5|nr:phosphotransferase family protein [Saccharopolyspora sp. NFXS83]MCX2730083.1 phosphotransferase [Saccharopolyspora sp. NFXS83]